MSYRPSPATSHPRFPSFQPSPPLQFASTVPAHPSQSARSARPASMNIPLQYQTKDVWSSSNYNAGNPTAAWESSQVQRAAQDSQTPLENVEMPSIYAEKKVDQTHVRWVSFFRERLQAMQAALGRWEETISGFEGRDFTGRINTTEYQGELTRVVDALVLIDGENRKVVEDMTAYVASLQPVQVTEPIPGPTAELQMVCSVCQEGKQMSNLSCPFHHVLCLDCAAYRYLRKDLKCICDCPWSLEQCRSLHSSLLAYSPSLAASLPAEPHLPLNEVQCQHCFKLVGLPAIDQYICAQSHNICIPCAKKLGQTCPLCSQLTH